MQKKHLHLFIGTILIVLSLYFAFKGVSLSELIGALRQANYIYLFPAVIVVLLSYILRAMRWSFIVGTVKEVGTMRLLSPMMIGFMANMLPARAGEFIRAYILSRKEKLSFSSSFATIFIERLFDLMMVLLLLICVLVFMPDVFIKGDASYDMITKVRLFGFTSLAVCIFIIIFAVMLQYKHDLALKIANFFLKPFPSKWQDKGMSMLRSFTEGLSIIRDPKGLVATITLSIMIWLVFVITYYPFYFAFNIQDRLPVIQSLVVLCLVVSVFITVAPTPGFLGSYHLGCVATLHGIFGIQKAVALSYGIVAWIVAMGLTIAIGALYAVKENISISAVASEKESS